MVAAAMTSCNDDETYADQLESENKAIKSYISTKHIKVISESEFYAKDSVTDTAANEYVFFHNSGIYMQIVNKGCGQKIKRGETTRVLCRYTEVNILNGPDSIQSTNNVLYYQAIVDKMTVTNTSGTLLWLFRYQVESDVPNLWFYRIRYRCAVGMVSAVCIHQCGTSGQCHGSVGKGQAYSPVDARTVERYNSRLSMLLRDNFRAWKINLKF